MTQKYLTDKELTDLRDQALGSRSLQFVMGVHSKLLDSSRALREAFNSSPDTVDYVDGGLLHMSCISAVSSHFDNCGR